MGYFPNGTAGMAYEEEWCMRCANSSTDAQCMVWGLHMLYNYEQCDGTDRGKGIAEMLDMLIPRTEDGPGNGKCTMFRGDRRAEDNPWANQRRVRLRLLSDTGLLLEAADNLERCAGDPELVRELEERAVR